MKLGTLMVLAAAVALPAAALAEGGSSGGSSGASSAGSSSTTGAAGSSTSPPSPGVSQNAPGQQRRTNGASGDPGSNAGMEASDVGGSGDANTGRSTTTPNGNTGSPSR
jgi:hypothetical protein